PANPSLQIGGTQPFTATGTYSDSSTRDITGEVVWSSTASAVATITSTGVATAQGSGSTTIRATQGAVNGSTTLTVADSPPAITTATLPAGVLSAAYSAALTGTGGKTPYTWAIASGS